MLWNFQDVKTITGRFKLLESSFRQLQHVPTWFPGTVQGLAQASGHLQFTCNRLKSETKKILDLIPFVPVSLSGRIPETSCICWPWWFDCRKHHTIYAKPVFFSYQLCSCRPNSLHIHVTNINLNPWTRKEEGRKKSYCHTVSHTGV